MRLAPAAAQPGRRCIGLPVLEEAPQLLACLVELLASQRALDPTVDLVPLPTDGNLTVVATKARTGVSWTAPRQVALTQT